MYSFHLRLYHLRTPMTSRYEETQPHVHQFLQMRRWSSSAAFYSMFICVVRTSRCYYMRCLYCSLLIFNILLCSQGRERSLCGADFLKIFYFTRNFMSFFLLKFTLLAKLFLLLGQTLKVIQYFLNYSNFKLVRNQYSPISETTHRKENTVTQMLSRTSVYKL